MTDFNEVARRLRDARLHQGYQAGDLLLSTTRSPFGHKKYSADGRVFEAYKHIYQEAARRIVP